MILSLEASLCFGMLIDSTDGHLNLLSFSFLGNKVSFGLGTQLNLNFRKVIAKEKNFNNFGLKGFF